MKCKVIRLLPLLFSISLSSCNKNEIKKYDYFNFLIQTDEIVEVPEYKNEPKTFINLNQHYYHKYSYNFSEGYKLISQIINTSTFYDMPNMVGFWTKGITYIYDDDTYFEVFIEDAMIYSEYFDDSYVIYVNGSNTKNEGNHFFCVYQNKYLYEKIINYFEDCKKVADDKELTWYQITH